MRQRMITASVLLVVLACVIAAVAEKKVLLRTDGTTLVGEVTLTDDGAYEVKMDGGTVTVPAEKVASIKPYVAPEDEYARRRAALHAKDHKGHYQLALWCISKKLIPQAKTELKTVLRLVPDHENAKLRLELLEAQSPSSNGGGTTGTGSTGTGRPPPPVDTSFLMTEKDIQQIRQTELRSTDLLSITFDNKVIERYIEKMKARGEYTNRAAEVAFRRKKPIPKALEIFRECPDDPELLADIRIRGDGPFIRTFKMRIWPAIERNCASNRCHGSPKGGGKLKLYIKRPAGQLDRFYFTNFYILDSYQTRLGRLVDRNSISDSLLLQHGLPAKAARRKHPTTLTRPPYRDTKDARFTAIDGWIRQLRHPHPGYDVDYVVPGARRRGGTGGAKPATPSGTGKAPGPPRR